MIYQYHIHSVNGKVDEHIETGVVICFGDIITKPDATYKVIGRTLDTANPAKIELTLATFTVIK